MVASSSGWWRRSATRAPGLAIDDNPKTDYTSAGAMDWIQLDLGKEYQVEGTKVTKGAGSQVYFQNVQVSFIIYKTVTVNSKQFGKHTIMGSRCELETLMQRGPHHQSC
jgi:hypothetical protein